MGRKRLYALYYALIWLSLAIAIVALVILPDRIPAHYNAAGQVTRWGSKLESLIFPALYIPFGYLMAVIAKWTGKRTGSWPSERLTMLCNFGCFAFLEAMQVYFLYTSLQQVENLNAVPLDYWKITGVGTGVILASVGNYMPKVKKPGPVGLRFPWIMDNEETWRKCQRFGGWARTVGGVFLAAASLFLTGPAVLVWLAGDTLAILAVCTVYSLIVS